MHLLLQGPIGVGKSWLLLKALAPVAAELAGLQTQRLQQNGQTLGFRACAIQGALVPAAIPYQPPTDGVFLMQGRQNLAVLEQVIAQVEELVHLPNIKLILLDEIGGVELASEPFMAALQRILACGKPCIGVLKSRQNLANTTAQLQLAQDYPSLHQTLADSILAKGRILTVSAVNKSEIAAELQQYLAAIFKN